MPNSESHIGYCDYCDTVLCLAMLYFSINNNLQCIENQCVQFQQLSEEEEETEEEDQKKNRNSLRMRKLFRSLILL